MDEWTFIIFLLVCAIVVAPIILLIKQQSLSVKINDVSKQLQEINKKLNSVLERKDVLLTSKEATERVTASTKLQTIKEETEAVKTALETVVQEKPVAIKATPTAPPLIVATDENIVPELQKSESVKEEVVTKKTEPVFQEKATQTTLKPKVEKREKMPSLFTKNIIEPLSGGNWFSKIGIITLVLGIGFFVKYAIDQNWINEIGRVAIGFLAGGMIIGLAQKLKKKYIVFASILAGGGIAVLYITITLAFREYQIFSQTLAFALLILVTLFSVATSLLYNRQELAIFSLVGGFLSPLMLSTGSGNYIVLFSFLLILNCGMLFISLKKNWKLTGVIAFFLSLGFYWTWLLKMFEVEFMGATIFASLFFIQFYLLALIKHYKEQKKLTLFQGILILVNNMSMLFSSMYIFNQYQYDVQGLVTILIALFNAVVLVVLFRQSRIDRNVIYLIIGIVMSLVSLAIPIQLKGHVITMFWAAEVVLFLWLWQRSRINVFRIGFLAMTLLVIISYIMDVNNGYYSFAQLSPFRNGLFVTGIAVLFAFSVSLFLLLKENRKEVIAVKERNFFSIKDITTGFKYLVLILAFSIPYMELNHQLISYTDLDYIHSFRILSLATYTSLFIAITAFIYRKKITLFKFFVFLLGIIAYVVFYTNFTIDLRGNIYFDLFYSKSYFLLHFVSLPAIGYLFCLLIRNLHVISQRFFTILCWVLLISAAIILSIELDHVVVVLFSTPENYHTLLYDVHTFGYPILWGLIAMTLMVWGLKKRVVVLRKISLISFGLIIVKFYASDVWIMSQGGRIVSFVILGIILLFVSFLQQKIKVLVQESSENKEQEKEDLQQ